MAKLREETGEVLSKPKAPRGFPWRLWLYAIVITGAAGAGGYFTWHYRGKAIKDAETAASCTKQLSGVTNEAATHAKLASDRKTELDTTTTKAKELETQLAALSTNLNASKDELTTLRAQRAEQEKRLAAIDDFQKQFSKMISAGQVHVSARRGSLVLSLPAEVLFASGSADLSEKGTFAVVEIGATLKKLTDRRFLIVGHTDDVPLKGGVFKDNWELSAARALNVTRTLVKAGMDAKNLVPSGVGENDPISRDRAKNRRIEIALLPAIDELPPLPKSLTADDEQPKK